MLGILLYKVTINFWGENVNEFHIASFDPIDERDIEFYFNDIPELQPYIVPEFDEDGTYIESHIDENCKFVIEEVHPYLLTTNTYTDGHVKGSWPNMVKA